MAGAVKAARERKRKKAIREKKEFTQRERASDAERAARSEAVGRTLRKQKRLGIKRGPEGKIIEQRVHRIDKSTGKSFAEFGRKKRKSA